MQTCSIQEAAKTSLISAVHDRVNDLRFVGSWFEDGAREAGLYDMSNGAG